MNHAYPVHNVCKEYAYISSYTACYASSITRCWYLVKFRENIPIIINYTTIIIQQQLRVYNFEISLQLHRLYVNECANFGMSY